MTDDRRAIIAEALEASEAENTPVETTSPEPVASEPAPAPEPAEAPSDEPTGEAAPNADKPAADKPTEATTTTQSADKAPQSWKPAERAKWATLDPTVRQEVMRREREITKTLGETAQARQFTNAFSQAVQPYAARIASMNVHPIQAVQELLKTDHILSTAPMTQRAGMIAKLIKDYGVDIRELDSVLSGQPQTDPVQSQVDKLLAQKLAPYENFMRQQEQMTQQQQQQTDSQIQQSLTSMSEDPKFNYFDDVRHEMGDIIELSAKRGVYLTLEQAYNKAVSLNPEISQLVNQQSQAQAAKVQATQQNSRAQRALAASRSVGGTPATVVTGSANPNDRRATIEAAFEGLGAR